MMLPAVAVAYAAFVAAVTLLLHLARPRWRGRSIVRVASLTLPVAVLIAAAAGVASIMVQTPPADEIDASGMAMLVYLLGGSMLAGVMLGVGLPASLLTIRRLRPAGGGSAR